MKVSAITFARAIPKSEIESLISKSSEQLSKSTLDLIVRFASEVSPESTQAFERDFFDFILEFCRTVVEQLFNSLEPPEADQLAVVSHRRNSYRKLHHQTPREVITRFGKITLMRSRYRRGRSGKTIFPLEVALGLQQGATPLASSLIGKQFATTGSSQGRTIEFAEEHLACSLGVGRLRKLGQHLAQELEPFRQQCQQTQLLQWLAAARKTTAQSVVLSVSRDAVSLGLAPFGFFEMASVATISVLADGKRLGTVYLGRTPETNQKTLSQQLSSLLRLTLKSCGHQLHVVYVTDAGKVETAYWRNELSKFYVDGKRIKIHRVVDYYHASERLTVLADCLKLGKSKRWKWLEGMRKLLKEKGGHGRVMRSVSAMKRKYGIKSRKKSDLEKAVGYLNNQKRFMDYFRMKSNHFPIGSGVVESACKQIVSERMKLSGMRWKQAGAQAVMTLRCILLSGIWNQAFDKMLQSKSPVTPVTLTDDKRFAEPTGA